MKSAEVSITCPSCKRAFKQKVLELSPSRARTCPHCRVKVKFTGDDVGKAVEGIADQLNKIVKRFGH